MKKSILVLLLVCLLAMSLAACGGVDGPIGLGHRYGNPKLSYADGKVTIKYVCVDCDYYELEERAVSTQVSDAQAWDEIFQNFSLTKYSLEFRTYLRDKVELQHCVVTEDRGYYTHSVINAHDVNQYGDEYYTLQKEDGTYITYIRSGEDGTVSLAPETDGAYWEDMKTGSEVYLSLTGMFDQFTYDAKSGSYISSEPMEVELMDGNGLSLGVKTVWYVCVNIADGQILSIKADYSEVNEYLESSKFGFTFYNIGFSVVKVPQHFIEAVTGKSDTVDSGVFTYQLHNGKATITGVNTAVGGVLPIPAFLDGYPVVAIGALAFRSCANVTEVVIPDTVTTIGDNAFLGCAGLSSVKYGGTQEQWNIIAIGEIGNEALLNATIHFGENCEHTWDEGTVAKQSTCGTAGIKVHTCTTCGAQKPEYLPQLGEHSYGSGVVTEEATCRDAGIITYTCSVCGKLKTEYIPKLATHTYTNGTCTSCGADDPHYADNTDGGEKEIGGIIGAVLRLVQAVIDLFSFF